MSTTTNGQASVTVETKPDSPKKSSSRATRAVEAPAGGESPPSKKSARSSKKKPGRRGGGTARQSPTKTAARKPGRKPYPVVGFGDVIVLAEGIMKHNAGQPAKRETLLRAMGLEPGTKSTRNLITNSGKYGLTEGHHSAETLKLTPKGATAVDPKAKRIDQLKARFSLAIADVVEFIALFEKRKGNNMPTPEMLHDDLQQVDAGDRKACADVFISNVKFLGMLVDRDGAQYLMTVEEWLARVGGGPSAAVVLTTSPAENDTPPSIDTAPAQFEKVCFVMSTIRDPGSEERKHADMILSQYVERALEGAGLKVVRADRIGDPGMISKQVSEHIVYSKLVVADLSFHNPNVFYEICLRHVTGKPTVHLIQESDHIPFDLGNFRTIKIDTSDKYKMVSELDTLRSEIATAIKLALTNGESRDNPILTYLPNAKFVMNADEWRQE